MQKVEANQANQAKRKTSKGNYLISPRYVRNHTFLRCTEPYCIVRNLHDVATTACGPRSFVNINISQLFVLIMTFHGPVEFVIVTRSLGDKKSERFKNSDDAKHKEYPVSYTSFA